MTKGRKMRKVSTFADQFLKFQVTESIEFTMKQTIYHSILASEDLLHDNKKIQWQNVTPSGDRIQASHYLWFQVQHYPFWTNLTFVCKTETLGSLYGHAVLILTKSSKSKNQVVHKQNFKDLSRTCLTSSERRVLWEAWVLSPLEVTFFTGFFVFM